jgi:methyltransferase (TIGR00027 family)
VKPVSKTAFYCCAIRAWDAEAPTPVLGDEYAKLFMTDETRALMEPYRAERYPNAANVVRPRIIEDALRDDLARNPARRVVLVGAGFDSRAFRLPGGRWVEIDEEAVLDHKEPRLPARSARNELVRIPIDFATETLADKLASYRGETEVTVVVEGVTMYLTQHQIGDLARTLIATFPRHSLMADLVTARFMARYGVGIQARLAQLGARFGELVDCPEAPFLAAGYRPAWRRSLMRAVREYRAAPMPWLVLNTLLLPGIRGSQVWRFEYGG